MGLTKRYLMALEEEQRAHASDCGLFWDSPCICNDECPRCGSRFYEDPDSPSGVCADCWSDVLSH